MSKRVHLVGWVILTVGGFLLLWGWGLTCSRQIVAADTAPVGLTPITDSDCALQAVTVTASHLGVTPGISDTLVGSAEDRAVYFANPQSGVLTLTAAVSANHTTCYLWGGNAFDQSAAEFVPGIGNTYWLTYTVPASQATSSLLPMPLVVTSSWSITGTALITLSDQVWLSLTQDIAPPNIELTTPSRISATVFTVAWSVYDASAGIASSTVAYSGTDDVTWQEWITHTDAGSATFTVPFMPETTRFRVTACDYVGNCSDLEKTTRIAPIHIYLPFTFQNWVWWYTLDIYEPNNSPQQAYGPLELNQLYEAYIWDSTDTDDFYFVEGTGNALNFSLDVPLNSDLDLYVYVYEGGQYILKGYSNQYGLGVDETTVLSTSQGTIYYVRVYPYLLGLGDHLPYILQITP